MKELDVYCNNRPKEHSFPVTENALAEKEKEAEVKVEELTKICNISPDTHNNNALGEDVTAAKDKLCTAVSQTPAKFRRESFMHLQNRRI